MIDIENLKVITALKTPYMKSGEIDYSAWADLLEYQISEGVCGFVVAGTTGEGHLMEWREQLNLIERSVAQVGSRAAIVGNTGSNSTKEALHATREGFSAGMTYALQVNPYYGRTSYIGMREHFLRVLDIGPSILYNVPVRTGQDIPLSLIGELSSHTNFVGVKECCGIERIQQHVLNGVRVWSGNDSDFRDAISLAGAFGVISVVSNLLPRAVASMVSSGNKLRNDSFDLVVNWLGSEPNPIGINTALTMIHACKPVFRLPYLPLARESRAYGVQLINNVADRRIKTSGVDVLLDEEFVVIS